MAKNGTKLMIAAALMGVSPTAVMAQQRVVAPTYDQIFNACSTKDATFGKTFQACMTAQGVAPQTQQVQQTVAPVIPQTSARPVAYENSLYPTPPVRGEAAALYRADTAACRAQYSTAAQNQLLRSCMDSANFTFRESRADEQARLRAANEFGRACEAFSRQTAAQQTRTIATIGALIGLADRGARSNTGKIATGALGVITLLDGRGVARQTYGVSKEACAGYTQYLQSVSFSPRQY